MKRISALFLCIVMLALSCFNGCGVLFEDNDDDPDTGTVSSVVYHTVTFNTNGGTSVASKSIKKLESAPQTTKDGYIFDGWFRDKNLTEAVVYPLSISDDITLYAGWVKKEDTKTCSNCKIKFMDDSYSSNLSCNITPSGFDYDKLEHYGANGLTVTVTYTVYYRKDYDVWLDIGYAGSPKYEASISNSSGYGKFLSDLTTSTSSRTRTISLSTTFDYFKNGSLYLTFSTDNIQNVIYFKDITVTYECVKIN